MGKRIVNMGFPPPNHRLSPQAYACYRFSRTHIGHKPLDNLAEETTFRANQAQTLHKPCANPGANLAQTKRNLHKRTLDRDTARPQSCMGLGERHWDSLLLVTRQVRRLRTDRQAASSGRARGGQQSARRQGEAASA